MAYDHPLMNGLASIADALDYRRQMERQAKLDEIASKEQGQRTTLADLQIKAAQLKNSQDEEYRNRIASLKPSETVIPAQPAQYAPRVAKLTAEPGLFGGPKQMRSLADIANLSNFGKPSDGITADLPERVMTSPPTPERKVITQPNALAEGAKIRMSQGRTDEAAHLLNLDDALAQYEAKVKQGGGDIREFYAKKEKIERMKQFFETIKPYVGKPGALESMWPQLVEMYPEAAKTDPSKFKVSANGIIHPFVGPDGKEVVGKSYYYDETGKMNVLDTTDKEALLDKRLAAQSADTDKKIAAADARSQRGDFKIDDSNRKWSAALRKEFNNLPEIKESNSVMPKISSMHKAMEESLKTKNFVAVDQALITLYNKLTDPTSVVRESEYARTAQNIPLLNNIKGKVQKVMEGGAGLTQDERDALMKMADLMYQGYSEIRENRVKEYNGYAVAGGVDPKTVINDEHRPAPKDNGGSTLPKPPKSGAKIPVGIAQQYIKQYGSAQKAREAAKAAGWSF